MHKTIIEMGCVATLQEDDVTVCHTDAGEWTYTIPYNQEILWLEDCPDSNVQEFDERGAEWKQRKELGACCNVPGEINTGDDVGNDERTGWVDDPNVLDTLCALAD